VDPEHYYVDLAEAYLRGMGDKPEQEGLRLHRFKRTAMLPRVRRVLGVLRAFAPKTIVDIGSGRGVFLWPLLDEFDEVQVVATDLAQHRLAHVAAVRRGGVERLHTTRANACNLPLANDAVDMVTALEVLEHLENPGAAARELIRVARTAVVVSVPSKADDNPEHIQLFNKDSLTELLTVAGARSVNIDYVLNHIVAVATV